MVGHDGAVRGLSIFENDFKETIVVSASEDATIRTWNVKTGELDKTITGKHGSVRDVAVYRDSTNSFTAVSANASGFLLFHDLVDEHEEVEITLDTHIWSSKLENGINLVVDRTGWLHILKHDGTKGMALLFIPLR
ncbi:hypothetical protein HK096_009569, partial [Nowakowskiella sp. JEL0078]